MRRLIGLVIILLVMAVPIAAQTLSPITPSSTGQSQQAKQALADLAKLEVKGRAAKTGYTRAQYGDGWQDILGCDMRNIILRRDMKDVRLSTTCKVLSGTLHDPYTGKIIAFSRGADTSDDVQIDHVVALSDSWQKGAKALTFSRRVALANDPLELLAVDGRANQDKMDSDAASWLPPNKAFRCQYVARQIAVNLKYSLWVTSAEMSAMRNVLAQC